MLSSRVRTGTVQGSPRSKLIQLQVSGTSGETRECECDLMSIDCLDSIACIVSLDDGINDNSDNNAYQQIHAGIIKRRALKESLEAVWDQPLGDSYDWAPLGKTLQSLSIKLWREWLLNNQLPTGMFGKSQEGFVNASAYPYCIENDLKGKLCYFGNFVASEEYGELEAEAIKKYEEQGIAQGATGPSSNQKIRLLDGAKAELQNMRENPDKLSPYAYLLAFAHISKITFHLRRHMMDLYERRVKTIQPANTTDVHGENSTNSVLRVALHVRRGDACMHALDGYSETASPLDSPAQQSGQRHCYATSVYIETLQRAHKIANKDKLRHLVVYVATDHMESLMDEIKDNHREVYDSMTWKYVQYPRQMFNYSANLSQGSEFIEWAPNKHFLGETAIVDIHHLSHGQIFIGHLGSRFGKLSWWQAMGRHNSFVPFFTVDGHSVCCDIDEACGAIAPAIVSMDNCLAFSRDDSKYENDGDSYWKIGATVRFQAAADELGGVESAAKMKAREQVALNTTHASNVPGELAKLLHEIEKGSLMAT